MPNRLAREKSPYLLQHAENPVDWHPWGAEALERARQEAKPILVSIGYSACHWCHVMAHESFEDEETAQLMNNRFVNIKVDREERPDVDAIYMEAVQAMTQHGGWPLNVFLLPDGRPFYGGTYFPPQPRHGMPSWKQILENVSSAFKDRHQDVAQNASILTHYIREAQLPRGSHEDLTPALLSDAYQTASRQFDWTQGGFGSAPKFPQPLSLELMLRMWRRFGDEQALAFVRLSLNRMAKGGIFDQLGGGFHRYTVDGAWVVPHFEKMLYDNALLARVYTLAWQATHDAMYRTVAEGTLDYLLREMLSPEGGFYSAEDADSEGEEGKFYVWTTRQLDEILGEDAEAFGLHYGVTPSGNFEGKTILTVSMSIEDVADRTGLDHAQVAEALNRARHTLLETRATRVAPGKDTKILVSWNALAVRALAEAGRAFDRADYLDAAQRAADFIESEMRPDGELVRSYREGPASIPAFLEDYAFLVEALISLYETTFNPQYLRRAEVLADEMITKFRDASSGLFFDTAEASAELVVRPRSLFDNPIPSGNSAAAFGLLRLHAHTGESRYEEITSPTFQSVREMLPKAPTGFAYLLCALDFSLSAALQIAIVAEDPVDTRHMVEKLFRRYLPNKVVAVGQAGDSPLLAERVALGGRSTAYVCEHFACRMPVCDPEELAAQLDAAP